MNPRTASDERMKRHRCSYCRETGHNWRSCLKRKGFILAERVVVEEFPLRRFDLFRSMTGHELVEARAFLSGVVDEIDAEMRERDGRHRIAHLPHQKEKGS